MIKKSVLDSIDEKLLHMRRLYNFLKKYKSDPHLYRVLKREARGLDTMMREAVKRGDVGFPCDKKSR